MAIVSYEGDKNSDGLLDGNGKAVFASGASYEGQFKAGKMHGKGKLVFKDGMTYQGDFKESTSTGKGVSDAAADLA